MEVRKGKRIRLDLPVDITHLDEDGEIVFRTSGRLHDLSPGGCALHMMEQIAVSERVQVRINLSPELTAKFRKSELTARGVIIRSVHGDAGYLLTIRFQHAKQGKSQNAK